MELKVGQQAPDFSLYNTEKKEVSLSSLREQNVLLLFFPLAFTSTCTEELCSVRDNLKMYEELSVLPVGISVDSLFCLKKYKEDQNLNFPLLSDFNKEVSKAYGSLYEDWGFKWKGVTKRSAFLIDRNGTIQYAEVLENASDLPNFGAIEGKVRELTK
jgi:peroxiredoxin